MIIPSFVLLWLSQFFVVKYYPPSYQAEYFYPLTTDDLHVGAFHRRVDDKQQLALYLLPLDIICHGQSYIFACFQL
jgi:hypothetical protein